MAEEARCPMCKHTSATTSQRGWYCHWCRQEFAPPEPGDGDYSDRNPAARLEREERRREQRLSFRRRTT